MTDAPIEIEGTWLDNEARLALYRAWFNPCEILHKDLVASTLWEHNGVVSIAEDALDKLLYVVPSTDPQFSSRTAAADLVLNSFLIQFGAGLNARLALILRLIFDRTDKGPLLALLSSHRSEHATMMRPAERRETIDPRYADLLGVRIAQPKQQLSWWVDKVPVDPEESFESRNGFRYGHFFILLHEMSHIALHHFEAEEIAMAEADHPDRTLLRLGFESQADIYALLNLIVYIDCFVEAQAVSEFGPPDAELTAEQRRRRDIFVVAARGAEFRSALFGIFSVMSCFSPLLWTNLDFKDEDYLQPTTRLGLAVKILEKLGVPFDGRPAFFCFDFIEEAAIAEPISTDSATIEYGWGAPRKWGWSEFFSTAIYEWDMEVARFQNDMRDMHGLPISPNPFAIHRSGLDYSRATFDRYKAATELAERYQWGEGLFVSSEGYIRHLRSKFL